MPSTKLDRVVEPALDRALAADREHLRIDVAHGRARAGPARRDDAERDVAGAAGDVEEPERLLAARRVDGGDQRVLPGAVQAARHQVVHQVVAPRHRPEDVVHQPLFGVEVDGLEAEMGVAAGFCHGIFLSARP